jgi:electron transfer flavoprotein beta subunit
VTVAVCLKWVTPVGSSDDRFAGVSAADQAALESALVWAELHHSDVVVVTVGPIGAERALRDALACGATRAVRIDGDPNASSIDVARAVVPHVASAALVWCGDYSLDRGSGSFPAHLADALDVEQALGLIDIGVDDANGRIRAVRRLDGGRREILSIAPPAVLSVEGSVARLRRAPLRALLDADRQAIDVHVVGLHGDELELVPYRPRARVLAAPAGSSALDRVRVLTDAGAAPTRAETVELTPDEAADRILDALRDWGYLT